MSKLGKVVAILVVSFRSCLELAADGDLLKKAAKLFLLVIIGEQALRVSNKLPELSLPLIKLGRIGLPLKECLILANSPGLVLLWQLREAVL